LIMITMALSSTAMAMFTKNSAKKFLSPKQTRLMMYNTADSKRLFKEDINMLYDSKCNLCLMEVRYLYKKDVAGKIKFTDLEDPKYNPSDPANAEISYETGMKSMHAVLANGEVITGVRVFRELYTTIGLGWLYGFTRYPVIKPIIDKLYDTWAVYRTDLTRGTPVDVLIQQRNNALERKTSTSAAQLNNGENACFAMKEVK